MRPSWRGVNRLFLVSSSCSSAAEGHLTAFAPLQLRALGLSDAEVAVWSGLLFATVYVGALPFAPFWGVLAERYSRRAVIIRSYVLLAVALVVAALAQDLPMLVVSRFLVGLSFGNGGVVTATQVMLTPRREMSRAVAMIQAAQPIAVSLGPPLGALVIPLYGTGGLFLADAVMMVAVVVVSFLLLPEPEGGHRPSSVLRRVVEVFRLAWRLEPVRWNFINQFLFRGANSVVETYLPVRISELSANPATAIGVILGAYGLLTTLVAWILSRVIDRPLLGRVYVPIMAFSFVTALALAFAPWLELVALLALSRAVPVALSRPLLFAHLAWVVPREHQTAVFGLFPMAGNVGALIMPLVAAALAGFGTAAALSVSAAVFAAGTAAGSRLTAAMERGDDA